MASYGALIGSSKMIYSNETLHLMKGQVLRPSICTLDSQDTTVDEYDLGQLTDITTVEPIEIDEQRQATLRNSTVMKNVCTGAVAGAAIDYLSPGDSIVNGILVGAMVGWFFAPAKKDPVAHLVLHFSDGETLPVTGDRVALTHLISCISANGTIDNSTPTCSHRVRALTRSEKDMRHQHRSREKSISRALIAFLITFVLFSFVFSPLDSELHTSLIAGLSEVFAASGKATVVALTIGGIVGVVNYFSSMRLRA